MLYCFSILTIRNPTNTTQTNNKQKNKTFDSPIAVNKGKLHKMHVWIHCQIGIITRRVTVIFAKASLQNFNKITVPVIQKKNHNATMILSNSPLIQTFVE